MTELVESIKEYGLLNRIIVRPLEDKPDEYEIISGHRRVRAAELLEIKEDFDKQLSAGLIDEYNDFHETIPVVLKRLKLIDFSKINFVARSSWLLQDTNYSKLMNNQFAKMEDNIETLIQRQKEKENSGHG